MCNIQCVAWAFITKLTCVKTNDSNVFVVSWYPGCEVSWPFQKNSIFRWIKMYEQNGAIKFQMTLCRSLENEIRLMTNRLIYNYVWHHQHDVFLRKNCSESSKSASKAERTKSCRNINWLSLSPSWSRAGISMVWKNKISRNFSVISKVLIPNFHTIHRPFIKRLRTIFFFSMWEWLWNERNYCAIPDGLIVEDFLWDLRCHDCKMKMIVNWFQVGRGVTHGKGKNHLRHLRWLRELRKLQQSPNNFWQ